jgi:hypothetical protein
MFWVAVCALRLAGYNAGAAVIDVPADASTIQAAINAADDGDTVRVAPGTYAVNLDYKGKSVCVTSASGPEVTILMPAVPSQHAVVCTSGEPIGAQLLGFTLTGAANLGPALVNIASGSSLTIQYCMIRDNPVDNVVIQCAGSGIVIRYNLFVRNGGISCIGANLGTTSILNNTFDSNNRGFYCIGGITLATGNIISNCAEYGVYGAFVSLSYNDLWNNGQDYTGGAVAGTGSIYSDPIYSDPAADDYSLQSASPCIDGGNPDPAYDDPDGSRNDIGAFPLGGYFLQPPLVKSISVGTLGDSLHVVEHTPQIAWDYEDKWGLPHTASEAEVGSDEQWPVAEMWNPPVIYGSATSAVYAGTALADGQTYYVRVRVYNDTLWSNWRGASFRMNGRPGGCELLFPPHEAIVLTDCPTLVAMNTTDPDGDPLKYDFFVSLDEGHYDIVATAFGVSAGYGQTDWTVRDLTSENQLHWWRARASDGFEAGTWSDARAFWLDGCNDPPGPCELLFPDDGAADLELRPAFAWEPAEDADPGSTLQYTVSLATDAGFTLVTETDAASETTIVWPHLLSTQSAYWWKVTADDGRGGISVSGVWSFQTSSLCTPCPHQSDFDGDGYSNAIDIGFLIDILFAGGLDIQDPGCQVTRSDFDCDGYATTLDLGALIDYLFAGGVPPCDPCAL